MYVANGVFTEKKAIEKALQDFEKRGIQCIQYADGSYRDIDDYTDMAIKTASQRAYLTGEGEMRKKIGNTLIRISKHGGTCPLCAKWEDKVLIDDVYSGGTRADGDYPLLSEAMAQGLYHPRCRHGCGTYYPELEDVFENNMQNDKLSAGKEISKNPLKNNNNSDNIKTVKNSEKDIDKKANVQYCKGINSFDNKTQERIRNSETIITGNNYETALVYDRNGNLIMKKRGGEQEVNFDSEEFSKLKDCVVTHNHPNGSCFSPDDIKSFYKGGMDELRACNSKVCYSMKAPTNWSAEIKSYDIEKMYYKYDAEISNKFMDISAQEGKNIFYYDKKIQEEVLSRIADDMGFKFEIEVKK